MDDRFRFRAWDKFKKVMRFVYSIDMTPQCEDISYIGTVDGRSNDVWCYTKGHNCEEYDIAALEIMRCTGLKDKNGKTLIYEGDIVVRVLEFLTSKLETKMRVFYNENHGAYCIKDINGHNETYLHDYLHMDFKLEVVGNIFENPELLESEGV